MNKQNKTKLYAKALAEVLAKKGIDEKKVVNNFAKILVDAGYEKKSKEILSLTEDFILQKQGNDKINFQTARKITAGQKKLLQSLAKDGDKIKETINLDLIAGIKIIINDNKQFDASMQNKLQNIF